VSSYLLDTSCLVAAVCAWHRHHDATRVATLVTWDLEGFERFLEDEPAVRALEAR
jgi:hypothetical protein